MSPPCWSAAFIYPFSDFATPAGAAGRAARLPARHQGRDPGSPAAYWPRRVMPRALKMSTSWCGTAASFKLWAVAIQAMLKETLNIETNLRTVQMSVWFDEAQAGNFRPDHQCHCVDADGPLRLLQRLVRQGRAAELLQMAQQAFEALVPQIDRELDETKRKALIRQAEDIMEQDPPLLPVSWEKINDGWYNYVKGHNPY